MILKQLIEKLSEIKNMGFITTHKLHDTGIGKTLENLLDIKENNISLPDIGDIELKAKRIDSQSMLTIITRAPKPRGTNRILFESYKYINEKGGYYNLHSTVYGSKYNPQGFKINIKDDRLILENKNNIEAYWLISIFDNILKAKSNKILLVFAETSGERKTSDEQFRFAEAYLLSNLKDIEKLKEAVKNDKLKIDIRIGVYNSGTRKGKYHDHGTAFRINKKNFLEIFDKYEQLI